MTRRPTKLNVSDLIPQYNYNLDILNVYVNGIKLVEGRDFNQVHNAERNDDCFSFLRS